MGVKERETIDFKGLFTNGIQYFMIFIMPPIFSLIVRNFLAQNKLQ